jgi:hypothetical protein
VAGGTALAQLKDHTGLWTVALIFVLVLSIAGGLAVVIGGIGAFVTRPVPADHAATLKASARSLQQGLESRFCDYGEGYNPRQAFCAHYSKLGEKLQEWDELRAAAAEAQRLVGVKVDELMAEHGIVSGNYNLDQIRGHVRGLGMERANGRLTELPSIEWAWTTTAGGMVPGPPVGVLGPGPSIDWILLPPLDGETRDDWRERATPFVERIEGFRRAAFDGVFPSAEVACQAAERVAAFKRDALPTISDALRLIELREAPRIRHRCESC